METGVYVHIPFCRKKCLYCDFLSFAGLESLYEAYKNALLNELRQVIEMKEYQISTIYIGGGTPTAMPPLFLSEILTALLKYKTVPNPEITVEVNPGCMGEQSGATCRLEQPFSILRRSGANRLSIGLQAWQDRLLAKIGRIHCLDDFLWSYDMAARAGFSNINVDIMFSLPGQSMADWRQTLEQVATLEPAHISAYGLTIEEETPFGKLYREGKLPLPSENTDREMYETAKAILSDRGYRHYEISNFAKQDFYARHNVNYWKRGPYIGLGLGAHSFVDGERFHNTCDLEKYLAVQGDKNAIIEDVVTLNQRDAMAETMFLGLRMLAGVRTADFNDRFGVDIFTVYGEAIRKLIEQNLLEVLDGSIRLTSLGIDVSNRVFCEFI